MFDSVASARQSGRFGSRLVLRLAAVAVMGFLAACGTSEVGSVSVDEPDTIGGAPAYASEAEVVSAMASFETREDDRASGGRYVLQPSVVPASTSGEEVASVTMDVAVAGAYTLWARVFAPDKRSDAIYLGLDGTTHRVYPADHGVYTWLQVEREELDVGQHRISIGYGEPGLQLDMLALVMAADADAGDLDRLVAAPSSGPSDPDRDLPTLPTLRGDPAFDPATLTGDAALWYWRLKDIIANPGTHFDPMACAARDDVYHYGRTLHTYVQAVLVAFRLTGDLALLDHVDEIAERMRAELRDPWRDTIDGTDGTTDGYLNWTERYESSYTFRGKDVMRVNEIKTHALVVSIAYALEVNRDLVSPSGRDYAAHADFWKDYLVNHFEAKWRERRDVPSGFPIMIRPGGHTYQSWIKWHYYMGLLTGDDGYTVEANRMADAVWNNLRSVSTPSGMAYVWPRSILEEGGSQDGLALTTYARYTYGDIVEFHLEGFHRWASTEEMQRFARTFTEFVIDRDDPLRDDGFASDVGGGVPRAGLDSDDGWSRLTVDKYRESGYALMAHWDDSDRLGELNAELLRRDEAEDMIHISAAVLLEAADGGATVIASR